MTCADLSEISIVVSENFSAIYLSGFRPVEFRYRFRMHKSYI